MINRWIYLSRLGMYTTQRPSDGIHYFWNMCMSGNKIRHWPPYDIDNKRNGIDRARQISPYLSIYQSYLVDWRWHRTRTVTKQEMILGVTTFTVHYCRLRIPHHHEETYFLFLYGSHYVPKNVFYTVASVNKTSIQSVSIQSQSSIPI